VKCSLETCSFTASATQEGVTPNFGSDDFLPGKRDLITIPSCPKCTQGLLRPAVVWRGEFLASGTFEQVEQWVASVPWIDIMLVIGTSGGLSSHYIEDARVRGAKIVHFNVARVDDVMEEGDWFIAGDAAQTVPHYLATHLDV
jgi:NAD-dependent SIR2 family protein deacetylase